MTWDHLVRIFFLLPKNGRRALISEWTIDFRRRAASTAEKKMLFSQGICSLIHFHSSCRNAKWALKQRETPIQLMSREGMLNTGGMNGGSAVVSRASGRGARPLSRCKLPSHLHVEPMGPTVPNGMFGIKVSHIRSGWKWDREEGWRKWGRMRRKCDWLNSSASGSGASKKKCRSNNSGVLSQRAVASGRAGALDVFRNEFHDFKKGLGSNGEHVGCGVIKQNGILSTVSRKFWKHSNAATSILSERWKMMFSCLQCSHLLLVEC